MSLALVEHGDFGAKGKSREAYVGSQEKDILVTSLLRIPGRTPTYAGFIPRPSLVVARAYCYFTELS